MKITDTDGAAIGYVPILLVAGQDSAPIVVIVTPETAQDTLSASLDANAGAFARLQGSGGAWIDLDANPIALGAYLGGSVNFEIIARAEAGVAGRAHANIFVGVKGASPAGWTV